VPGEFELVFPHFLRTESELVLKSRYVIPKILSNRGFKFQYPTWPEAAEDLCNEWKKLSS
jgi:NAD dependent epimerase/dehydratase family enzyme